MSRIDAAVDRAESAYDWVDSRLDLDDANDFLGKAFPAEDSFLLGEVALFCFGILVSTGTFLAFFYEPSTAAVEYGGSVAQYQGQEMPAAFKSVLNITYDVPFGMFLRRMHHWAAHLFVASIALHMLRVFFTGAYRNPREPNWLVGTGLAGLAMFAAYTGYSLPYDEFASTAVGIGYNVAASIPIVGDPLASIVFGGQFPTSATIPRLFFLHVFLIPAAIAGLIAVHMAILVRQKHTEAQRDEDVAAAGGGGGTAKTGGSAEATDGGARLIDRDDDSVVIGLPAFPNQAAVSAVVFFLTMAVLSLLAGLLPVHNIAQYGPNDPASTPSLVMPDWFLMWGYGFLKLTPSWMSFDVLGVHISSEFVGGLFLPSLVFVAVAVWPFIDRAEKPEHFTRNYLDRPFPTAVGILGVTLVMVASIAGMDVIVAEILGTSTAVLRPYLIAALVLVPAAAGTLTYAILGGFEDGSGAGGEEATTDDRPSSATEGSSDD
ncbi:cytochrome b [Halorubrum lacusprofundi]|jgi:menaquinol-cytochrome c reductase cytochrome b subunit precursor|uniref:Cytochrome b/b6 domain protein n=1 Tax=Halorubrum lacusprofundi (strain ATCC 49239 / DSM 5036 / JCM 8891 / ACAM 34) TaxID=416348 RepID=B9LNI7_HALLT|nr:cytochrome bc complex cytochrome b subunit [Halorubrum lacusprofundi]ACM56925.1 Cytochrome b/b6 domain protein [Halorubrum lacusprofundi ATCC 49239]MCG1006558.1 cytochrome bc complex cytochrome b subunit [Halorubrum lacusprofundi]